jgi:hypothetical protein
MSYAYKAICCIGKPNKKLCCNFKKFETFGLFELRSVGASVKQQSSFHEDARNDNLRYKQGRENFIQNCKSSADLYSRFGCLVDLHSYLYWYQLECFIDVPCYA